MPYSDESSIIRTHRDVSIDDIIHYIEEKRPEIDASEVRRAYTFAADAHGEQKRKSGDLYIVHPLATALFLTELNMDQATIIAGLLHDVPEDTAVSIDDVRAAFGEEVAFLVQGVTKLGQLKYRGEDRYVENLRRMFLAMAQDARVILIRFADRIHNLRTLSALPPEKQRRIALESLEIHAAIANRLGMGELKGIIEDLAFPYVYPEEYEWITKQMDLQWKQKEEFIADFVDYLKQEFDDRGVELVAMHGRRKHLYSLYKKLIKNNRDTGKIYDMVAVRVIVPNIAKCYETLGIIHEICKPLKGRIKDYISQPKPNGYQSLHTTVFSPARFATNEMYAEIVEIQIRTPEMHQEAEFGIAAHWQYKETKDGAKRTDPRMNWMKELVDLQENVTDTHQLLETLKIDIFQNTIFVFTPSGDVIELPEDASAVDFAYKIHSDLGNKCSGVKINGQQASLSDPLHSGDVVEILINPSRSGPSAGWLSFVKTTGARQQIRQYVNKKNGHFFERLGLRRKKSD